MIFNTAGTDGRTVVSQYDEYTTVIGAKSNVPVERTPGCTPAKVGIGVGGYYGNIVRLQSSPIDREQPEPGIDSLEAEVTNA